MAFSLYKLAAAVSILLRHFVFTPDHEEFTLFEPYGDHLSVNPKGFIPGNGGGGRRALVQLVQLVGVVVEGRLSGDSSLLLTRPEDPTKERRLPLSLSPEGAGQ